MMMRKMTTKMSKDTIMRLILTGPDLMVVTMSQMNMEMKTIDLTFENEKLTSFSDSQKKHLIKVLEDCDWKINGPKGAAQKLGMPPSTLRSKMKKLNIVRQQKL